MNRFSKKYIHGNNDKKSSRNLKKKTISKHVVYHEFLSSEALDRRLAYLVNPNSF